jgi:hypothetical protein
MADYLALAMEETPRYEGAVSTAPYRESTSNLYIPTTAGRINANPSFIDRADELRNLQGDVPLVVEAFAPDGAIAERAYINHLAFLLTLAGFKPTITTGNGLNQVWTLNTAAATGGTFTLTVSAQATTGLAHNSTSADIQAALEALSTVGAGNVVCTGGPINTTSVVITFRNAMGGKAVTVTGAFGGLTGTPYTLTNTAAGSPPTVTNPDFVAGQTFANNPQSYVGVGAYKYVFVKRTGVTAQSARLYAAYGTQGVFLKGQGYGVSSLTLDASGAMSAALVGLVCAAVADPGLTPSQDSSAILPVTRGDLYLQWLTGSGSPDDFNLAIANPLSAIPTFGLPTPSLYPDTLQHGDTWPKVTGSIPKREIDSDDLAALWTGETFSATARWRSRSYVGNSPSRYAAWFQMPACQYDQGNPDDLANRRRFGATFNWRAQIDEATGKDITITLVTGVSPAQLSSSQFSVYS